jgi:LPXTG-site transpeptidase (sortase) family protein
LACGHRFGLNDNGQARRTGTGPSRRQVREVRLAAVTRLGNALAFSGLLVVIFAITWLLGVLPGSRYEIPAPVAASQALAPSPTTATRTPLPPAATSPVPTATLGPPAPVAAPILTPAPILLAAADAEDRLNAAASPGGYAVRLAIPSIDLDTQVKQAGIVRDGHGDPAWETLPFVAVHYGDLTSLLGKPGNAVIAGHVVTLREGNVFRLLYKVALNDRIAVWDDHDRKHEYHVVAAKLVPPSDLSVMAPTPDETLTLITCGGSFDPVKREFSDRLIVTAKPLVAH